MLELRDYQKKAVKELKEKVIDLLESESDRRKIIFKAPTGAGKTVMASALLDELTRELSLKYMDAAFIWIAPNKLHLQSYMAFRNFFSETRSLRPVMFDDTTPADGLQPGQVLFLNWESINKANSVITRDNEQNKTLFLLTRKTIQNNLPIITIIDEEHMFAGKNAKKSEEVLQNICPKIELRISATPSDESLHLADYIVNVRRQDVIAEEMIKKNIQLNPQVKDSGIVGATMTEQLIDQALRRRDSLAKGYHEHNINPLLLIQLPNDTSDTLSAEEKTLIQQITTYLDVAKDIRTDNGKLAIWLSDRKENLEDISKNNNMVQVLLFKQAIALGWDCPRASVLLIFRDVKSKTFTAQTVGRILRMPEQCHYSNDALNYGYVYTNLSQDMIEIVKDDMNYISTIYAKRKQDITNISLLSVYQNRRKTPHVLMSPFKAELAKVITEYWELDAQELFDVNGEKSWDTLELTGDDNKDFSENRRRAETHQIKVDVTSIRYEIPRDLVFDGTEESVAVTSHARFAKTQSELLSAFNVFCRKNVGDYEPGQSAEMIRSAIYEFMEEYLGLDQNEAIKVVLFHNNRPKFEAYIKEAEQRYARDYEKREQERNATEYKDFEWQLPETRVYNSEVSHSCQGEIFNHALEPFFEENAVSTPEKVFSRLLDKSTEFVDWWYKNADSGHMHFAVPYNDINGEPRCFYVDYVIRLKNGTVCLFDTKTKDSDPNAPNKHNALLDYIEKENKQHNSRLMGGVIVPENENWYYCPLKIDNTKDITGWTALDLSSINVD